MSFTVRTITHSFSTPSGDTATGEVEFRLPDRMTNGTTTVMPGSVTAALTDGAISADLTANDDPDTVPTGTRWQAIIRLDDTETVTYSISVPSAGTGDIDLGDLLPGDPQAG